MTKSKSRFIIIFLILGLFIFLLSRCFQDKNEQTASDPRGEKFIGSSACKQCHNNIDDSYSGTSHFHASAEATKSNIQGSFHRDKNFFYYGKNVRVVMEERDSGLYQVVYKDNKEQEAHRFDISMGTQHAQTFLFWQGKKTFELPVSYLKSIDKWVPSPGFSSTEVKFTRFIGGDCFECHSSYVKSNIMMSTAGRSEELEKESLVAGIDCERCHGGSRQHVEYHLDNPDEKKSKFIIPIRSLSRQQKLDMCAQCHSGNNQMKVFSRFEFKPGDDLSRFFYGGVTDNARQDLDVHGNQYQLLTRSKCFIASNSLECSSCHSAHANASNNTTFYTSKCLSCHSSANRSFAQKSGISVTNNCVDRHMPAQPSKAISFEISKQEKVSYLLRTHQIAIYPEETRKVLAYIENLDKQNK